MLGGVIDAMLGGGDGVGDGSRTRISSSARRIGERDRRGDPNGGVIDADGVSEASPNGSVIGAGGVSEAIGDEGDDSDSGSMLLDIGQWTMDEERWTHNTIETSQI